MTRRDTLKKIAKMMRVKGAWRMTTDDIVKGIMEAIDSGLVPSCIIPDVYELLIEYDATHSTAKPIPVDLWNKIAELNDAIS